MQTSANNKIKATSRSVALTVLLKVIKQGQSLSQLKAQFQDLIDSRDRSLANEIVNGVLRWRWKLDALLSAFLKKPLKNKDTDIQIILFIAIYEITELDIPHYATVNEAVALVNAANKSWARGLVNAVLRNLIRDEDKSENESLKEHTAFYSHPSWLIDCLKADWPNHWRDIVDANNQRPPLWLRVNRLKNTRSEYQKKLESVSIVSSTHPVASDALKIGLTINVTQLPEFEEGSVSVQDAGAQLAARILDAKKGERVLDLCAAPGGKTCHLLELSPDIKKLVAVDNGEQRMLRVRENLDRLKLDATLITGDATNIESWWDGELFDCILIDAPCSATGVIRRHPDIKSLRRADDLPSLVKLQQDILQQAWAMLVAGGRLLYVTCSVLKQENEFQIKRFLSSHDDAVEEVINMDVGVDCEFGLQVLPGMVDMDGFYYAILAKRN